MSEREWGFYLKDMIIFSEKVLAYTKCNSETVPEVCKS